jgi:uncharacterized cupredoxin-like copper-binding protein
VPHHTIPKPFRSSRARLLAVLGAAILAVPAAACGDDGESLATNAEPATDARPAAEAESAAETAPAAEATSVLEVVSHDFSFELSSERLTAGMVRLSLRNDGTEAHQLSLARLHDGVTVEELADELHADELGAYDLVDFAGGVNPIDPGRSGTVQAELEPGRYAVLCFVPSPDDGVSHVHKGMVAEIEVVADGASAADVGGGSPPDVVGEAVLSDFAIAPPPGGFGEAGTYRFTNQGQEPHEAVFLRLDDGASMADLIAFQEAGGRGDPPFTFEGGPAAVAPGGTVYAQLDFEPGSWLAVCAIRGEHTDVPHLEMGMLLPFEVAPA